MLLRAAIASSTCTSTPPSWMPCSLAGAAKTGRGSPARQAFRLSYSIPMPRAGARLRRLLFPLPVYRDQQRVFALADHLAGDDALGHVRARWYLVHHVEHHVLDDRPKPARALLALEGLDRDLPHGVLPELQVHPVKFEELAVLPDQRILGLGQDIHQSLLIEGIQRGDHRNAPDKLRDHPEFQQVLGHDLRQHLAQRQVLLALDVRAETDRLLDALDEQ